jgi:hypothetical protein
MLSNLYGCRVMLHVVSLLGCTRKLHKHLCSLSIQSSMQYLLPSISFLQNFIQHTLIIMRYFTNESHWKCVKISTFHALMMNSATVRARWRERYYRFNTTVHEQAQWNRVCNIFHFDLIGVLIILVYFYVCSLKCLYLFMQFTRSFK